MPLRSFWASREVGQGHTLQAHRAEQAQGGYRLGPPGPEEEPREGVFGSTVLASEE